MMTPLPPAVGALNEHVNPDGSVGGQEKVNALGFKTVVPFGVTVTVTLPDAFGPRVRMAGLIDVVKAPPRVRPRAVT